MTYELDCSMGEGGGSVVRIAVALAAGKNASLKLYNIRSNRPNPGLRTQHIEAINAINKFSGMSSPDLYVGKTQLLLTKAEKENDVAQIKITTAGSIGLVAQAVMFYSFSQKRDLKIVINGGATHGKWAPSIEFIQHVTNHIVRRMNKNIETKIIRYGFFPKGGAVVHFNFKGYEHLEPLNIVEKGELDKFEIYSTVSKDLAIRHVAERQIESFLKKININVEVIHKPQYVDSFCSGTGLTVIGCYSSGTRMGSFVPGEKKLSAEKVGELCAILWRKNLNTTASVDIYATDQLIVPMALVEGKSEITTPEITNHTRTNIELVKKILKREISYKKDKDCFKITIN